MRTKSQVEYASQIATSSEPTALIELHDLSVAFGRQPVLRDIILSIPRGQTLAIIGESGCGKTVLLKTIIGLLHPDERPRRVRRPADRRAERQGADRRSAAGSASCFRTRPCSTA